MFLEPCQAQCFWSLVRPCLFWSHGQAPCFWSLVTPHLARINGFLEPCQAQYFWSLCRPNFFLQPCQAQCFWSLCRPNVSGAFAGPMPNVFLEPWKAQCFLEPCQAQCFWSLGLFWSLARPHVSGALFWSLAMVRPKFLEPLQAQPNVFKPCQAQCPMFFWGPMFLEPNASGALFLEAQCFWSLCRPKPMWSLGRPNVSRALSGQCLGPMLLEPWSVLEPCQAPCFWMPQVFGALPWSGPSFWSLCRPNVFL